MVPEFFVVGGEIARQLPPECSRVTVQVEQVAGAVMARRIVIVFPVVQVHQYPSVIVMSWEGSRAICCLIGVLPFRKPNTPRLDSS